MPVSGELPFPDQLDRKDDASFARVWHAQMPQIAIPFMGLPGLTVSTGLVGRDSGRRAGRLRPLPRGSLPCRGRSDRGRRNAVGADRSRRAESRRTRCLAIYDFTARSLAGEEVPLKRFEGQVLLIVNTASACGFTPQYKGLEELHRDSRRAAFRCSAFPATSSAPRSRATPGRSSSSATSKYAVTFPMFAKIDVNGGDCASLVRLSETREIGPARLVDQMEFHQIPGRSRRARWSRGTRRPHDPKD